MAAALSLAVLLSLSVFVVRVAAVALRLTGLAEGSARFQALSAFTGTGFTTSESESVVSYPIRRRIMSLLMIIGNMGFVTVFATIVVSLVYTEGQIGAVMAQLAWLLGALALLWYLILNRTADRIMCSFIGRILESTTLLGKRRFQRLLQVDSGYSICEHRVSRRLANALDPMIETKLNELNLTLLAFRLPTGEWSTDLRGLHKLNEGDRLILFGQDAGHENLALYLKDSTPEPK